MHLEGQHRRAARMESLHGRRDRFNRAGRFRTWESCRADIQRWDEATLRTKLALVLERLTNKPPMTWTFLLDPERNALTELRRKMTELEASGRVEQALQLAARTPYRWELFRRRPR